MTTRVLLLSLVLVLQAVLAFMSPLPEVDPGVPALETLPAQFGGWALLTDRPLEPVVFDQLRPQSYIVREYADEKTGARVNLFVAYFKSIVSDFGPHSPRHCLPGAGWISVSLEETRIPFPVNQYVLAKGRERILVFYWFQNQRRVWADDMLTKLYLVPDLLYHRRSEVAMVRVVIPMAEGAKEQSLSFIRSVFPLINERLQF